MKKVHIMIVTSVFLLFFSIAGGASANLIVNGDFQAGTQPVLSEFKSTTGPFGVWLGTADWDVVANEEAGKAAGDYYATQLINTQKLYQGFLAVPSGSQLTLTFDYVWSGGLTPGQDPAGFDQPAVYLIGYAAGQTFPWWFPGWPPTGDILYEDQFVPPTSATWMSRPTANISITSDYAAMMLVFFSGGSGGLRAIDNVVLASAPVPEPATMLLLGTGLIGLVGLGRKKFFKKA